MKITEYKRVLFDTIVSARYQGTKKAPWGGASFLPAELIIFLGYRLFDNLFLFVKFVHLFVHPEGEHKEN
ncbi:TPA: hypothetical protein U1272_000420 [Streptococcus suis]|nr:hypothetical protein [Streptococcus suis]